MFMQLPMTNHRESISEARPFPAFECTCGATAQISAAFVPSVEPDNYQSVLIRQALGQK
jgi:hypothetical protein